MDQVPPRTGSAPVYGGRPNLIRGKAPIVPDFRSGKNVAGLPSRPPPVPVAATGAPPPLATPEVEESKCTVEVEYRDDGIYEVSQFLRLKNCHAPVPDGVMNFARELWRKMPENFDSLMQSSALRESIFKGGNATMPSKVLRDRKLHHEVMGILGKVTDSNLAVMQKELTDLPIRQSTDQEIAEVINVFFNKSTRPEDTRYTPLYVKLIKHLISTIGDNEPAGRMIRTAILEQCRGTFLNASSDSKALEESIADLPEAEAELERMQFSGRQRANIYFLGLLFTSRLVRQGVVEAVLDNLLFGGHRRRRVVPGYCMIHFMELLQTCGPTCDKHFYEERVPYYRDFLQDLQHSHPEKRIQFLVQNFIETMDNNWEPVHGPGAKLQRFSTNQNSHNSSSPIASHVSPPPQEPRVKVPERGEFWKVMDDYFATGVVDDIVMMLANIPPDRAIAYCSQLFGRYITTFRYGKERTLLGALFEELISKGALTVQSAQAALLEHVRSVVKEDLFVHQPKYFAHWAVVIKNGKSVFTSSLHTALLGLLVNHHAFRETIVRAIEEVQKPREDTVRTDQKDYQPQERFRVLQALLRYTPPLLSKDGLHDDDGDGILADVRGIDIEVNYFLTLCESYDDNRIALALQEATEVLKKSPVHCYALLSAFFTFARFDAENLCTVYKDLLKKLFGSRTAVSLLEEVYVQWEYLDSPQTAFFAFVKRTQALGFVKSEGLDRLRERLRSEYDGNEFVASMDQYLK